MTRPVIRPGVTLLAYVPILKTPTADSDDVEFHETCPRPRSTTTTVSLENQELMPQSKNLSMQRCEGSKSFPNRRKKREKWGPIRIQFFVDTAAVPRVIGPTARVLSDTSPTKDSRSRPR